MRVVLALGVCLLLAAAGSDAQPAAKVYRVGVLGSDASVGLDVFRQTLADVGYIEGRNLVLDIRYDGGRPERLPAFAADLVKLKVDAILAVSSTHVRAAKAATRTIPIVFAVHNDPVGTGDVASLAHPGGNITGATQMATDLNAKQLTLLREIVPGLARVGVLWNSTTPSHEPALRTLEATARGLGVQVVKLEASDVPALERAFAAAAQQRVGAVFLLASPMTVQERQRVVGLAARHRLPTMYPSAIFVEAGGLVAYGTDTRELYRLAAGYVDRILKGARAADLPVVQPTTFELTVNVRAAKAIGLTIPPSVLARADAVLE